MNSIVQAASSGNGQRRVRRLAMAVPIALLLALGGVLATHSEPAAQLARDAALCPLDANMIGRRAIYLIDLRKPLDDHARALPSELLLQAAGELGVNDELRVHALTPFAEAPRMSIGRLCKPFADAELTARAAKDQRRAEGDCSDLPAQLPAALRTDAKRYCGLRATLEARIEDLALRPPPGVAGDAHLVDAFAEIDRSLQGQQQAQTTLYVFSDMMQHADWYSHLALGAGGEGREGGPSQVRAEGTLTWQFATFRQRRERRNASFGLASPPPAALRVKVFYLPLEGFTDHHESRRAHKQFWRDYFGDRQVVFMDQNTMPSYRWRLGTDAIGS